MKNPLDYLNTELGTNYTSIDMVNWNTISRFQKII